jgi:hypothetical protein
VAPTTGRIKERYDWRACGIALAAGLGAAIPAALASLWVSSSTLLLTAVVTTVGTSVSHWAYARVAKPGSRRIDDDTCPR